MFHYVHTAGLATPISSRVMAPGPRGYHDYPLLTCRIKQKQSFFKIDWYSQRGTGFDLQAKFTLFEISFQY